MDKEIVKATLTSLSSILTNITVSSDGECSIELEVSASVTESPLEVLSVDEDLHPVKDGKESKHEDDHPEYPDPTAAEILKEIDEALAHVHAPRGSGSHMRRRHRKVSHKQRAAQRKRHLQKLKHLLKSKRDMQRSPSRKDKLRAAKLAMARKRTRLMKLRTAKRRMSNRLQRRTRRGRPVHSRARRSHRSRSRRNRQA